MWPGTSLGGVVVLTVVFSEARLGAEPKSGSGRETVRTSWTRSSTSTVLISWNARSARAWQVRWTCSMQGEKEQSRPPAGGSGV